ncbi:MAG: RagB/SusD family nutrient uptake outer membrane protein [Gemmatimonadetes bacterium]|nr:RagB/SusD family nutrient uptake outer membrane protein [Gemmatimonadota bacterium]
MPRSMRIRARGTPGLFPTLLVLALAGAAAGCKTIDVPDLNAPGLSDLQANPTRSAVLTAATGLLIGARANWGSQNGPIPLLGILGREGYNFDAADPRFVSSLLIGPLSGGEPAFGGNLWFLHYQNIRNANLLLRAVSSIVEDPAAGLTAAEKEGVRGFAKTMQARELQMIIATRDANGAPIDVDVDPTADPAPIASRDQVYARIQTLLDEAVTHLNAAGASFAFALSAGFAGFDTPATFRQFNRALRARVAVYRDDWNTALTALSQSFLSTTAPLDRGVYHVFGTGSGDVLNAVFDPDARALHAHPSLRTDAQTRPGGGPDLRFVNKIKTIASKTVQGITTDIIFTVYQSPTARVPIIRNEELILLRAEANIGLNTGSSLAAARADLDFIRQNAGGLAPYSGPLNQAALLDELLYNKRYSLLWEGGHRWIDMRHYGRLADLPQDLPTHRRFPRFPFPINECTPRSPAPGGCTEVTGI